MFVSDKKSRSDSFSQYSEEASLPPLSAANAAAIAAGKDSPNSKRRSKQVLEKDKCVLIE